MLLAIGLISNACQSKKTDVANEAADSVAQDSVAKQLPKPISEPLVTHIFTADPSAHVFNGRIYIYPSHDIESNTAQDDEGGQPFVLEGAPVQAGDDRLPSWLAGVAEPGPPHGADGSQPAVGGGHHLCPPGRGVRLSGRHPRRL